MCYAAVGLGCRDSNDSFHLFLLLRCFYISAPCHSVLSPSLCFAFSMGSNIFYISLFSSSFFVFFYTSIAFVWFVVVCEQTQCKRILGDLTKVLHELFKAARQKQQATDVCFNTNT